MASTDRFYMPYQTGFDTAGAAGPGAKLYFYTTGTSTPKDTYSDSALATPNANPVVADAAGRFGSIFLGSGDYKVVLKDSNDVQIWSADPVAKFGNSAASTTVAGTIEIATVAEALLGTSTTLAIVPDTAAEMIQQGFSYGTTGGTGNAITVTPSVLPSALAAGMDVTFKASANNTSTTTLNYAGLGVVAVKVASLSGVSACIGGEIISGNSYRGTYSASDSAWLLAELGSARVRAVSVLAKTASYTVTDADRDGVIRFSSLSADATLSLPAASGRAGFEVTIVNASVFADNTSHATPYGVIVDPNSTELIDGFSTRKTFAYSRVTIVCDGTGWYTKAGKWRFVSGHQLVTVNTSVNVAHSLGVRPHMCGYYLQNTTAELGYTQYDLTFCYPDNTDGGFHTGLVIIPDGTNLNYLIGTTALWVMNKTTRAVANMTAASWRAILWAEA